MAIRTRRRDFVAALGSAATWSLAARAQQPAKIPRIGFLLPGPLTAFSLRTAAFRQGLLDLGYVEGKTVIIEWRAAEERVEQLPDLAAELVRLNADLIVTVGTPAAEAAKNATRTIPIVMAVVGDAVGSGLVASLAHPGGNVTGFTIVAPDLSGKRLELLKEIIPRVSNIAALLNPTNRTYHHELTEMQAAAMTLGLRLQPVEVSEPSRLENVFATMIRDHIQALVVLTDSIFYSERRQMVDLAAKSRLPSVYWDREFVENGAFMSFGPRPADLFRRSATYVDKILNGAKPADLPVEQPTKFELVINLKTARTLSIEVPPTLLARADEVIE
jgi:putative ABC transport system substrate-binding protein